MIAAAAATQAALTELAGLLHGRQRFLVTSHARPDGDAIGSALAMMHLLESLGKQVHVVFSDPIPVIYRALPGAERITRDLPADAPDALILLECDSIQRSGYAHIDAPFTINIDHHQSGRTFADFNWIDPTACAVGAMLYDFARFAGIALSPATATCLYAAVLTDTGAFMFASTTASTFALAEHLVQRGADPSAIAQAVYFNNPASKVHLLGLALSHLHVEGALAWAWITQADMAHAHAEVEDSEGIVNHLIGIAGVRAAVLLREAPGGSQFRLSLRSKPGFDVAVVAEAFGGGGHRNASGCNLAAPLDAALAAILPRLRAAIEAALPPAETSSRQNQL